MLQAADKKKITKTINDLGRRVTAADVSTRSGLPVLEVSQALNQIAAETSGRMAVSQNGDLVYSFALGFANAYLATGLKRFLIEKTGEPIFKVAYFLLRISFGIMLMASFFIVLFIFLLLFCAHKKESGSKKQQSSQMNFDYVNVMLGDAFRSLTSTAKQPVKYDYRVPTVRKRSKPNFLLDCFSFLFGDGDANEGISQKRWHLIARVIKQHDNVITAEQLAPYTGASPEDEDAVLPVLVRFNGKPEVTESGNIIYTFPALAVTAGSDNSETVPPYLTEFPCKFTEIDRSALIPVYWMAALNFAGSWILYLVLASKAAPSLTALLSTLVTYGSLFLLVPYARHLYLCVINMRIENRNERRAGYAEALNSPDPQLKTKIAEAREFRLRDRRVGAGNVVYTTEKNNLDQPDDLCLAFKPGDKIDASPEETFDASPRD